MKKMLSLGILACLIYSGFAFGQQVDYRLNLASGALAAQANLEAFIHTPQIVSKEIVNGHYVRLIQFYATPGQLQRAEMEAAGLKFLDYIPGHAFLVAIPQHFDLARLRAFQVRGVHTLKASHKLKRNLKDRPLPAWAVKVKGKVDVEVNFFPHLDQSLVRARLLQQGWEIRENTYPGTVPVRVPESQLEALAALPFVSFVEPISPPAEPENYTGRTLHRSNMAASDHPMGRHYDGTGVVVALGDDGIIGPHIDYQGRADQSRVSLNNGQHGDHVAGIICGAGNLDPTRRGMAFGAQLDVYQVWNAVNAGATSNPNDGVMLTSTSYGNGCNAGYTSFARTVDIMARTTPTLLHVFSAGNSGQANCNYGAGSGWGNITGGVKVGKNVLAVANLTANSALANSSSRGPASDGRIKPDIAAKGTSVWSTVNTNSYANFSGTSMAAPGVTGTLAQLIHAYRSLNNGQDPKSALTKAVLLNTADDLGNPGPDFSYGFGQINAHRAVLTLENQTYFHDSIAQGETDLFQVTVPSGTALMKVMVYWHDREASVNASTALVNNLNFTVTDPGNTSYNPWILDPSPNSTALNSPATRGIDNLNNMEQVTLTNPATGSYTFTVSGSNIPQGPQEYFLVYEFRSNAPTLTYPNGGEGFNPGETEKIRWDAEGNTGNWTVEYTTDGGTNWVNAASGLNGGLRYYNFNVPTNIQSGTVRFRVSRSGLSDESDFELSIIKVPTNLQVVSACPGSVTLTWDSLPNASEYVIHQLGSMYMDSIGTTSNASFMVTGTNSNDTYWFAVTALSSDGGRSRRTIAIEKQPGIFNCQQPNDIGSSAVPMPGTNLYSTCATGNAFPVQVLLENYGTNPISNFPVSYQLDGGTAVTEMFSGTLQPFDTASYTFTTSATIVTPGTHTIQTWTSFVSDAFLPNDSTSILLELVNGSAISIPFFEDFEGFTLCSTASNCETGLCPTSSGWRQSTNNVTDAIDWRVNRGATPSNNTGPSKDHNPGNAVGRYLYLEASNCYSKVAMLHTPCIDLSNAMSPKLQFWFNMNGSAMGRLHTDIFYNGEWVEDITPSISWNWGDTWRPRPVDLSPYVGGVVMIRFRGSTGLALTSDMAIDDISIMEPNALSPKSAEIGIEIFPNPSAGKFNFSLAQLPVEKIRLTIVDVAGRIVIEREMRNFTTELHGQFDLSDQSTGIYFLNVEVNGKTFGKMISLQK
ncbi:MAG TPA: T9SS type A sorting domain-containing protein [Bacteroidetes bacterium]|nr:T9SS type A sorting domain-containing protein [Bacteroidota bacterium]